jgi:hypothetical protein
MVFVSGHDLQRKPALPRRQTAAISETLNFGEAQLHGRGFISAYPKMEIKNFTYALLRATVWNFAAISYAIASDWVARDLRWCSV